MEKKFRYLVPGDYMADPAVHVFDGKLYIYPSHDRESGVEENDNGDHFDMCDYHVFSTEDVMNGTVTDHGVVLKVSDIPWAGRQLWDCDVARKNGNYYMYFPLKDRNDIFRMVMGTIICISAVYGAGSFSVIATTRHWSVRLFRLMVNRLCLHVW